MTRRVRRSGAWVLRWTTPDRPQGGPSRESRKTTTSKVRKLQERIRGGAIEIPDEGACSPMRSRPNGVLRMYRLAKNFLKSAIRAGSTGRPRASALTATIVCSVALVAGVLPVRADEDDRPLRIMTQNMDPGSRGQEIAAAGNDPAKFLAAVNATVVDILATKPA